MRQARRRRWEKPIGWAALPALACLLVALAWMALGPAEDGQAPSGTGGQAQPVGPGAPSVAERPGTGNEQEPRFEVVESPVGSAGPVARSEPPRSDGRAAAMQRELAPKLGRVLRKRSGGRYGVVIEDVASGARLEHNPRRVFPAASVYKLPLAYEVLRWRDAGWLNLDDRLTIEPEDAEEAEPEGGPAAGEELTIREALRAMLGVSSNSASHALLRQLGRRSFNAHLASLGLRNTRVPDDDDDEPAVTTAADMASLLRRLVREELLTVESRRELSEMLAVPEPLDPLPEVVPPGTTVLSKVGNLEDVSNVAGVILTQDGPLIVSIFDEDVEPGAARATIAEVVEVVLEAYAD